MFGVCFCFPIWGGCLLCFACFFFFVVNEGLQKLLLLGAKSFALDNLHPLLGKTAYLLVGGVNIFGKA